MEPEESINPHIKVLLSDSTQGNGLDTQLIVQRKTLNSQAPDVPELAHQGIF